MEHANLGDYVLFDDREPQRHAVFETDRLFSQVVCIGRNQAHGPVADPEADAMVTVLAGEAVVQAGKKRKRLRQLGAALIPAGSEATFTNASEDPLVILLVTAPPPPPAAG